MNMKFSSLSVLAMALCVLPSLADKVKVIEGESVFYLPRTMSRNAGEIEALERAKTDALGKEFGTQVSAQANAETRMSNGKGATDFWQSSNTLVRGEWVETIGKPEFTASIDAEGDFVISCKVKGKGRAIKSHKADLDIRVLRNGTTDEHESNTFVHEDKCYLALTAPQEGYLAVFMQLEDGTVCRMLPTFEDKSPCRRIDPSVRNLFFTTDSDTDQTYKLVTDKDNELATILVAFSPNKFVKPVDKSTGAELSLQEQSIEEFRKWVGKQTEFDADFQLRKIPISISRKVN